MELYIKRFEELTLDELYAILKLRVDVFVVEQKCPCDEIDNRDQAAIHVYLKDNNGIKAYVRILDRGVVSEHVTIGRVIAAQRNKGLGRRVMEEAIRAAQEILDADTIFLEAQVYAKGFYEKLGFKSVSEAFSMDGIPHVKMELKVRQ
jgi:ElaA protein